MIYITIFIYIYINYNNIYIGFWYEFWIVCCFCEWTWNAIIANVYVAYCVQILTGPAWIRIIFYIKWKELVALSNKFGMYGNRMGSIECSVFKILGIVKNYNFECLMMVCIIIGIIYTIFNWYGNELRWIYSNWMRNWSIMMKSMMIVL